MLLFASFVDHDDGVEPAKTQAWIGGTVPERIDHRLPAAVVVNEDILFGSFYQGQNVVLALHGRRSLRQIGCGMSPHWHSYRRKRMEKPKEFIKQKGPGWKAA